MAFEKQVKKAEEEKLKYRITRDIVFIVLGIIFLLISIVIANNKDKNNNESKKAYNNQIINII